MSCVEIMRERGVEVKETFRMIDQRYCAQVFTGYEQKLVLKTTLGLKSEKQLCLPRIFLLLGTPCGSAKLSSMPEIIENGSNAHSGELNDKGQYVFY